MNLWEQWARITKVVSLRNVFTKANIDSKWITIVISIVISKITIAITRVTTCYQRNAKENSMITFFLPWKICLLASWHWLWQLILIPLQKAQTTKTKVNKQNNIKLKTLGTIKETINKIIGNLWAIKNIFKLHFC